MLISNNNEKKIFNYWWKRIFRDKEEGSIEFFADELG